MKELRQWATFTKRYFHGFRSRTSLTCFENEIYDLFCGAGGFITWKPSLSILFFSFENIVQLKNKNTIFRTVKRSLNKLKSGSTWFLWLLKFACKLV